MLGPSFAITNCAFVLVVGVNCLSSSVVLLWAPFRVFNKCLDLWMIASKSLFSSVSLQLSVKYPWPILCIQQVEFSITCKFEYREAVSNILTWMKRGEAPSCQFQPSTAILGHSSNVFSQKYGPPSKLDAVVTSESEWMLVHWISGFVTATCPPSVCIGQNYWVPCVWNFVFNSKP